SFNVKYRSSFYSVYSQTNITSEQQYQGVLERVLFSIVASLPCCVFLFINGSMLFTLRSRPVFCETSRYILLYNLLFADTVQMVLSQLLFILATVRVKLTYPVCGFLVMLASLTKDISPQTLVVMSLERYVAVCYPLRHSTIITVRNTSVAITVIWTFNFPFEDLQSLEMKQVCNSLVMVLSPVSDHYDKAYNIFVFVSAFVAITSSYVGVTVAARSASTEKSSSSKARNTLLLHLVQLGFSLLSTVHNPVVLTVVKIVSRIIFVRIQTFLYVCLIILPKCLSALIYGLRDQTIRLYFMYHLCCRLKLSKPKVDPK
uniref:G-protein coupled receptors family 1 profile domain-containing protein n=1 Tax=Sphaeramia orbicularis TaxID=375764 RepID=A0A672YBS7_9TELE